MPTVLILGIIVFGMIVGAAAQWLLRGSGRVNWGLALAAGLLGSFIGGLLVSLIAGDGLQLRVSGLIGSIVGALIVTLVWQWLQARKAPPAPGGRKSSRRMS